MGVHGLWSLLEPVGKPVPLETLENKILAVDVSIWLHQATKGFRDSSGNPVPNAHLIGLCHRLCKLLFYKIKPVFVFDGGVPFLKRQTIAARSSMRASANQNNSKLAGKILDNYIKSGIINEQLGKGKTKLPAIKKSKQQPDLFELPPLPSGSQIGNHEESDEGDTSEDDYIDSGSIATHLKGHNIHSVDVTSKDFLALPTDVQHEILLELKDTRKQSSWNRINQMPQAAGEFSGFQVERLLKRRLLQKRLDEIEKQVTKKNHEEAGFGLDEEIIASQRIISDSNTHYVLIKKALEKTGSSENQKKETVLPTTVDVFSDQDENGFSQEELFAILGGGPPPRVISSSSSESDFEEVPETNSAKPLVLTIDPTNYNEEDDLFADVFKPVASKQPEVEEVSFLSSSEDDEKSDIEVLETVPTDDSISNPFEKEIIAPKEREATQPEKSSAPLSSAPAVALEIIPLDPSDKSDPDINQSLLTESVEGPKQVELESVKEVSTVPEEAVVQNLPETPDDDMEIVEELLIQSHSPAIPVQTSEPLPIRPVVSKPIVIDERRREELEELQRNINKEQTILIQEQGRQERMGTSITDQMYAEAQELLRLFGIPYLIAPMEAEAQCAFLDEAGLTQGTITDDSDIWLFGGQRVYKNFFNQGKYVEFFKAEDIFNVFKMGREKLIHLALLTGSDYTEGIQGVGPVCALEILAEFPSDGLEALERFRDWLNHVQSKKNAPPENKIRQKIRNLSINPGFPSRAVVDAYKQPEINSSRERFSWTEPDLEALQHYLHEKIGWNRNKFNSMVLPVLQKFQTKESQTRIDSYFSFKFPSKTNIIMSKRVMDAIHKAADFGNESNSENGEEEEASVAPISKAKEPSGKKRKAVAAGSRKPTVSKKSSVVESGGPTASTSGASAQEQVIWQREQDKKALADNMKRAIEVFKKTRGRGTKRPIPQRPAKTSTAYLSESSDSN